jgi:threonyl-tRNA synthetase
MAQAILKLYPEAKLTIGPVVEDGFYYDIDMAPVSEDDFPKIEAEMQKIISAKMPIVRKEISKSQALDFFRKEPYKIELISDLQDGIISLYEQGDFADLCRGPHVPHDGQSFGIMGGDQSNFRIGGNGMVQIDRLAVYVHGHSVSGQSF